MARIPPKAPHLIGLSAPPVPSWGMLELTPDYLILSRSVERVLTEFGLQKKTLQVSAH